MQFIDMVRDVIGQIEYKPGWKILNHWERGNKLYLQLECESGVCSVSKEPSPWKGRKQYLSPFMCKQEIIGICFALIKDAEQHEMQEWFKYKGVAIYNPHLDPDRLVEFAKNQSNISIRDDQMTKV